MGEARYPGERLARANRIRRPPEFRAVLGGGARGVASLLVAFLAPGPPGSGRLGVVASRRIGGAVSRSRAKRRLREVYRRSRRRPAGDLVLVARRGICEAPWPLVVRDYAAALARARRARPRAEGSALARERRRK